MTTYISQQKVQLLDSLENQVYFSKLVAVLVGDKGIGKTFLLEQLYSRLNSDITIVNIDASLAMSEDQLDKTVSLQLGLSWQKTDVSLETRIKNDIEQKVLIVIDDAHLLSSSCLNFILKLNQIQSEYQDPNLFIILAGDNRLPNMINQTDVFSAHQDMCVVFQIETIEQNETNHLIAHFSQSSVASIENLYSSKKLTSFWKLSKGNPAELNYHLFRELDEHSPIKTVDVNNEPSSSYFKSILYVLIAVLLISILVFQKGINSWISSNDDENILEKTNIILPIDVKSESLPDKNEATKTTEESRLKLKIKTKVESVLEEQIKSVEVFDKQVEKNVVDSEKSSASDNDDVTAQKISKKEIVTVENIYTSDENDLINNKSTNFVLQWTGVSQFETALMFKNKHPLTAEMKIYRKLSKNKLLYLVVSGNYKTKALAEKGREKFKQQGINGKPWIKSNSAVQNEISDFNMK